MSGDTSVCSVGFGVDARKVVPSTCIYSPSPSCGRCMCGRYAIRFIRIVLKQRVCAFSVRSPLANYSHYAYALRRRLGVVPGCVPWTSGNFHCRERSPVVAAGFL
jgi:hypothetical protein